MPYGVHVNHLLGVKPRYLSFVGVALLSMFVALAPNIASAEDSIIDVTVCTASSQASLVITSPSPDAKVASLPVAVSGEITLLSQIRVYVDDVYDATIPVDSGATTFTYNLTTSPGKHEILFEGVAICGTNPSDTRMLTYVPPQLPPPAGGTIGSVPAATNTSNSTVSGEPVAQGGSAPLTIAGVDVADVVSDIVYNSMVALDFATPESLETLPAMITRFALITAGMTAMVFAVPLVRIISSALPRPTMGGIGATGKSIAIHPHTHQIVRVVGAIMFIIPIIWNS